MVLFLTSALLLSVAQLSGAAFNVYWNNQHERCKNEHNIEVDLGQFGIIHNDGQTFYGNKVNILYKAFTGLFPRIDDDGTLINGGVPIPSVADYSEHILAFLKNLTDKVPNANEGPLVLDFEEYWPQYASAPSNYRNAAISAIQSQNPELSETEVEIEAERQFNETVIDYFQILLDTVNILRPNTLVGYYHYPYCSNGVAPCDQCKPERSELNDMLGWMYERSKALYPSLYTKEFGDAADYRTNLMSTRMKETNRINTNNVPVLPYINYRYKDGDKNLVHNKVMIKTLWTIKYYGGDGAVVWTSWNNYGTYEKCDEFKKYFDSKLGPLLKCFKDMPDDVANVLKYRYPLYPEEAGQIDPSTLTPEAIAIVDEMENKSNVDVTSDDHIWVTRRIISMYCRNQ